MLALQTPPQSFSKPKSKYIFKTAFQNILTMEEGFYHENPSIAASKLFPLNWHFKPWDLCRPQSYYATILELTDSVKFKHFKLHTTHSKHAYSTCIIHKIIHPFDWGQPLHKPKHFPMQFRTSPQDFQTSYSYWDYQQAWFNAFFLQNQNHSHSWLFYFHSDINTTNLPLWFLQWWDYFGCHVDYLKDHPLVENGYLHFKNNFQPLPSERKFSSLFIFCTNFFVPWVCSWFYDYNLQNGHLVLTRKFKIKWWDSFAAEHKSSKIVVTDWLQKHQKTPIIDHHPQSKFLARKAQTAALLASTRIEEEYLQIVQGIIHSQEPTSVLPSSNSSTSSSPAISLGNDNEDDCFGILPPISRQ